MGVGKGLGKNPAKARWDIEFLQRILGQARGLLLPREASWLRDPPDVVDPRPVAKGEFPKPYRGNLFQTLVSAISFSQSLPTSHDHM